jgi:gamma-glutamylaminecyclotransferase
MTKMTRVFVYGSLKSGFHNNRFLTENGARLLRRDVRTSKGFALYSLGRFPAMVDVGEGDEGVVTGELWNVSERCLAALDRLEGHPDFYTRTTILLEGGRSASAYLLSPVGVRGCPYIESGVWTDSDAA